MQNEKQSYSPVGVLFAIFVVVTAIMAPPVMDFIPFWGPLQTISDDNRGICTGIAIFLILLCATAKSKVMSFEWQAVPLILLGLHLLVFVKNFSSIGFAAFSFLFGVMLLLATTYFVGRTMVAEQGGCWWPLVLVSFGFLAVNLLQYKINPAATMQVSGRFHGVTSNPQMYALTTAIMVPALLYQYTKSRNKIVRLLALSAFIPLLFFSLYSGSRLSLLLSVVSALMFYRARIAQLAAFAIPLMIIVIIGLQYTEQDVPNAAHSHITSLENTRASVWQTQVHEFIENPTFGAPLAPGQRVGFGENSFLASGASLGAPGFIFAVALGIALARKVFQLILLERKVGWQPELAMPIAVLSTCLFGGFFEAFLLGIFTFPMTSLLYAFFVADGIGKRITAETLAKPHQSPVPAKNAIQSAQPMSPAHQPARGFMAKRNVGSFTARSGPTRMPGRIRH